MIFSRKAELDESRFERRILMSSSPKGNLIKCFCHSQDAWPMNTY